MEKACEAAGQADSARMGAARRRRLQAQRATARHVEWLRRLGRDLASHHTSAEQPFGSQGSAPTAVLQALSDFQRRLAKLEDLVQRFDVSGFAAQHRAEVEPEGPHPTVVQQQLTCGDVQLQDSGLADCQRVPEPEKATVHHDDSSDFQDGISAGSTPSLHHGGRHGTVVLINRLEDTLGVRLSPVGVTNVDHQLEQGDLKDGTSAEGRRCVAQRRNLGEESPVTAVEPEGLSELNLRVAELLRKRDGTADLICRLEDKLGVRLGSEVGVTGNADHQLEQAFQVLVQQEGDLEEAKAELQQFQDAQQQKAALGRGQSVDVDGCKSSLCGGAALRSRNGSRTGA